MTKNGPQITQLLRESRSNADAHQRLYDAIYQDLRQVARFRVAASRPGQTLSVTALVNETYLKLTSGSDQDWQDRAHFLKVAATAMRQITIDHLRAKQAAKRPSGAIAVSLDVVPLAAEQKSEMILALEDGLIALASENPRLVQVVELRFFAGMTVAESAEALHVSPSTIERDWREAKRWLKRYLA